MLAWLTWFVQRCRKYPVIQSQCNWWAKKDGSTDSFVLMRVMWLEYANGISTLQTVLLPISSGLFALLNRTSPGLTS